MALISNFPTFSYISWSGLIIVSQDETPCVINDGNTNCKYVYWDTTNPYTLNATNDKLTTSASRFLIYVNDNGIGTQVPQDIIAIQYREGGGVLISKLQGQVSELDGKYYAIKEDIDGIEKIIGSSETSEDGTLIDKVNKIEQTANGTLETISQLQTKYEGDKESEEMRDNILSSLITMITTLSEYQNEVSNACEDFEISNEEKSSITEYQNTFKEKVNAVFLIHDELVKKIDRDENKEIIRLLNLAKSNLEMSVNNLNTNVNTSISDFTVVPSEITTMLNMFSLVGVRAEDYKNTLSDAIILGVGGEIIENILTVNKTATEFNQSMSEIVEIIDGETGLKKQIAKNETNITQTAEEIRLNYVKYDKTTAELTVSDNTIKLDAAKVLMTGTLTWDSLDDNARENLKGEKGQNGTAEYVMLTGDQFIKCAANGTPSKPSVTINTLISGITDIPNIVWKYKQENSGTWVDIASNNNKTFYSLSATSSIWGGKDSITIRAIVNSIYYDDLTVVKVRDGIDGSLAEYVELIGEQSFKYTLGKGTTEFVSTPTVIVLEGIAHNLTSTNTRWYYKYPGQTGWTLMSDYNGKNTISIFPDDPILFKNYDVVQIKFELNTHYDVITINKLYDGKDSVMAILSNETHIVPCTSDGEIVSLNGASTDLTIYVGSIDDTAKWNTTITTDGVVGTLSNNNKTFTVTDLLSDIGYVDFVSIKDNFDSVSKRFTITKSKNGLDGTTGKDSTSYWILSSASAIVKKENGTYEPSSITLNAKCKQGEKEIADYECKFVISELIDEEWIEKYTSSNKESAYTYKIDNPSAIKVGIYLNDTLIDEEHIPVILDGVKTPVAFLDNDSHIIPCNFNGNPLNYEGALTTMYIYLGSTDDSENWKFTISENGMIGTITNNNRTYQVAKLDNDNAYVDITASKKGYEDITRRFSVSKAKYGKDGDSAKYIHIDGEQVFKYAENFEGTPNPGVIQLKATRYNISSNGKWQYKNANNEYIDMNVTTDNITITPSSGMFETQNTSTFRFIAEEYYDEKTIIKIADGSNGLPGSDGEDGIYILITNESHSVPCNSEGNYEIEELAKATTEVYVYKGIEEIDADVSLKTNGCQAIYSVANKTVTLTELTANTATVTITITVEGKTFTKIMTITKSLQGANGKDGNGINVIGKLGSVSDLPTDGNPGDAYLIDGKLYLWSENDNSWSDGMDIRGEQGLPGKDGIDGRTTYFHIKYSNDGKTFTENNGETLGDWIGQYIDFYEEDSNNFNDYKWKKIKGEDGINGMVAILSNDSHTIPCLEDGTECIFTGCSSKISLFLGAEELTNGVSYSYETSENIGGEWYSTTGTYTVTAMNNVDSGYVDLTAYYNGISYTKRFTITKNKQGKDAITINLSNDNHSFVANSEGIIEYSQSTTIEISAYKGNVKQNVSIGGLPDVNGLILSSNGIDKITVSTNNNLQLAESGTIDIPIVVNDESFIKKFTYTRVDCGADGQDGLDGYTIYLTNELHSFYCESNGSILEEQSTITTVKAFYGANEKTPTIGTITNPNGLSITKNGATLTIKTDGRTLADNGSFNIPITVDGRNFVKVFSWVKTYKGKDGQDGVNAKYVVVSGEQVFRYPKGSNTPTPSTIVLSVSRFNTTEKGKWQYKNANGEYVDVGSISDTLTVTPSSGTLLDTGSCTFRYTLGSCYDDITIVEISDGIDGNSGQTFYTWIMYADDANGKNISNNPDGKSYIGLSYNNTEAKESTDPTKYKWTLIKGADGVEGAKGEDGRTYYTWIKYSDNANGSNMYDTPKTSTQYIGIATNKTSQTESTVATDYVWSKFKGDTGQAGKDAYTVVLTNENHSFIAENNGNIPSTLTTTCQVLAYKGTVAVTPTIGTITNPNGMTITKSGTTLTINANVGTSLATSGTVTIPVIVDGITFNKIFSWVKVLKGADGKDGANGTDANIPDWIKEWNGNATTINGSSVITPKIFAGTMDSGKPTGVAIGKDVFGTSSSYPVNGIVGYKNGVKTYEFNSNGTMLIGSKSGQYISWDGSNLELNVKTLKISASDVSTKTYVDGQISSVNSTVSSINQSVDSINLEIKKTNEKINEIDVGTTNLFRYSNFAREDVLTYWALSNSAFNSEYIATYTTMGRNLDIDKHIKNEKVYRSRIDIAKAVAAGVTYVSFYPYVNSSRYYMKLEANTEYTFSYWVYLSGNAQSTHATIYYKNDSGSNVKLTQTEAITTYTGAFQKCTVTFTTNSYNEILIVFYHYYKSTLTTGTCDVYIYQPLLTKGNKVIDWSENPLDIEEYENGYTRTQVEEAKSSIQTTIDTINLSVSNLGLTVDKKADSSTVTTLSNTVSKNTTSINGINTTVSNLTKTVNAKADGSTVTSLSEKVSSIQTNINSITSKVSSVESKALNNYNNLLINSNIKNGVEGWKLTNLVYKTSLNQATTTSTKPSDRHTILIGNNNDNTAQTRYMDSTKFIVQAGEKISISYYVNTNPYVNTCNVYILFTDNTQSIETNNTYMTGYTYTSTPGNTSWTKKTQTVTVPTGATRAFVRIRVATNAKPTTTDTARAALASIMVSRGEDYPTWTANTEDSYISHEKRLTSAEEKITADAIISTVTSSTEFMKQGDISRLRLAINQDANGANDGEIRLYGVDANGKTLTSGNVQVTLSGKKYNIPVQTINPYYSTIGVPLNQPIYIAYQTTLAKVYSLWKDTKGWHKLDTGSAMGDGTAKVEGVSWGNYHIIGTYMLENKELVDYGFLYDSPVKDLSGMASSSEITQLSDEISLKVSKDGIISSINQSAEAVKINAKKIQLEGAVTVANKSGDSIRINNADYEIFNGSKSKAFFGLRTLDDSRLVPRLAMAHAGLDHTKNNYFVITTYPELENPQMDDFSYVDMAYRCQRFKNTEGYGDVSNIKMYATGDIRISPIRNLVIATNFVNNEYVNENEHTLATFATANSEYFNSHLQVGCIRNVSNGNGLILADDSEYFDSNSNTCRVRVDVDNDGVRYFRPLTNAGNIRLGSSGYPWYRLTATLAESVTSDRRKKDNIQYINETINPNAPRSTEYTLEDMYNFVKDDLSLATYTMKNDETNDLKYGFIAQDIIDTKVGYNIIDQNNEEDYIGYDTMNYTNALAGALKMAINKIEQLEQRIKELENKIEEK